MFALAGSHRSGKTTLARALADRMGIEFLETKVGDVFADLGIDPKAPLPFDKRLDVQNEILKTLDAQYALRKGKIFIADRSPFDVMGYTQADITRDAIDPKHRDLVAGHYQYAQRIIAQNLLAVMVLYPLPDQADAPGKAQACPYYMDHVYVTIKGMVETLSPHIRGLLTATCQSYDLDERIDDGLYFFGTLKEAIKPEPKIWTPNS